MRSAILLTILLGCPSLTMADDLAEYDQQAKEVTGQLLKELGSALKQQMKEDGPEAAINTCEELAPEIVNRISIEKGWRVTRVGTRVRNPLLGTPDSWEQDAFAYFERKMAGGNNLDSMVYSEIVEEPDGHYYRFMKPLGVKPVCTVCHGDPVQIPVQIKNRYPHDRATGYKAGDLRGGVSIKRLLLK